MRDKPEPWRGGHCVDPFCNRRIDAPAALCLFGVTPPAMKPNPKTGSGSHGVGPLLKPGVLFSCRRIDALTALRLSGVTPPAWMEP